MWSVSITFPLLIVTFRLAESPFPTDLTLLLGRTVTPSDRTLSVVHSER